MQHVKFILAIIGIIFGFNSEAQQNSIGDTIYREGDLYPLLEGIENDKMLQLERMTALVFHHTLNEYRAQKGKKTIFWDDKLWLAARNHTIYLFTYNKFLTHSQSDKGDRFTGRGPEARVYYVTYGSRDHTMTGFENCAVSGEMSPGPIDLNYAGSLTYAEMLEQAKFDAADMFDMWKNSPGHNQNMLDAEHLAHGTSIVYNHATGATYATSVFTQVQKYYGPDSLDLSFYPGWQTEFNANYKENYPEYKPYPQGMNRLSFKYFSSIAQHMKELGIEPDKHLYELSKEAPVNASQRELKKRYLKGTFYLGIFKLMKYTIEGQYFEQMYTSDEFYTLKGISDLHAHISATPELRNAKLWGGTFDTKDTGTGQTVITFRTCTLIPKK
jgi:uncharacterized protein YkwD